MKIEHVHADHLPSLLKLCLEAEEKLGRLVCFFPLDGGIDRYQFHLTVMKLRHQLQEIAFSATQPR